MILTLNGQNIDLPDGLSLKDAVSRFTKTPEHVVTEINGKIVAHTAWEKTSLSANDTIELITFVGGG